jgi:hypothetical protein
MLINRSSDRREAAKSGDHHCYIPTNKPDHKGSGSLFAWPGGGKPFISNSTLMKIIGSQMSIGMARSLFSREEPGPRKRACTPRAF